MLQIYDTLTKQKKLFKPINPNKVGLYVCGVTVYDYCHIGHGRVMVSFDVIKRYLEHVGYTVHFVRNFTDIDDKIIHRANDNGEDFKALTERFIKAAQEDSINLGNIPPDDEPRATAYISHIIEMVQQLVDKGHAYVALDGDVYFDVHSFPTYGNLSHKDLESLQAGARIELVSTKKSPLDFVLWKMAKPQEPAWHSPWGDGRPGWHIECSAMSTHCLGNHFDIHGGGFDLTFPHHENEIAQSEAATGEHFVNTWMHVGFVTIDREKMSKSLGNFFTIREVLAKYSPEVVRYFLLSSHYRSQLNYSNVALDNAQAALNRFYLALRDLSDIDEKPACQSEYAQRFFQAMDDDFNTPVALAVLFDLSREINKLRDENDLGTAKQLAAELKKLANILGILQQDPNAYFHDDQSIDADEVEKIESLIAQRNAARTQKDWAQADKVRQQLTDMNILLEDGPNGTSWRRGSGLDG